MREGRIVLPLDAFTMDAGDKAVSALAAAFGGVTAFQGRGLWKDTVELINVIDVAYEPNWENDTKLYEIASTFQQEAKQESVYVRYANGTVQFVTAQSCMNSGSPEAFSWDKLKADLNEPDDDENDIPLDEGHPQPLTMVP